MDDPDVNQVAKEVGCTPAQVLVNWNIARGLSVIPKTANVGRLEANMKELELTAEQVHKLENLKIHNRFCDPKYFWKIDLFKE